jgi:Protein of unknown function (DUF2924)
MSRERHCGDVGETSSQSNAETLDATVAGLGDLDADQLRLQWRNHLGGAPPAHLPRWLLLRVLAYRLQAAALGDFDKATQRSIRASQGDAIDFACSPFKKRKPRTRDGIGLNPGALLVREWRGKLERVMVLDKGFAWNGRTFGSLSQVAKAVTGTSWNGHRFFGLQSLQSVKGQGSKRRGAGSGSDESRQSEFDHSKDLGQAVAKGDRRGASKGVGRGPYERSGAQAKCPAGHLTRSRIRIPEPTPPVPVEGEPRQNIVEGSP